MKKILIIGYIGFNNFGDEALLYILINDLIKTGFHRDEITVISNNPEETTLIHKVRSINRWNLFDIFNSILKNNVVFFIGGLFQDKSSLRSFLWYLLILITSQLFGKEIALYAAGVGPFQRKISQILFDVFAKNINYSTARDQISSNILSYKSHVPVTCDPVWLIESDFNVQKKIQNVNWQSSVLGVSVRFDKNLKEHHLSNIGNKLCKLLHETKDWQVLVIPCMDEDLQVSLELYDYIISKLPEPDKLILLDNFSSFSITEQAGILASCNAMVGMRYHSLIIPLANGKPVFGLIFDYKIKSLLDFASQVGITPKDDLEGPWNYFWQNLDGSTDAAKNASEKAKKLQVKNTELLKKIYNS